MRWTVCLVLVCLAREAEAQGSGSRAQRRLLDSASARSRTTVFQADGLWELRDGRVVVSDAMQRKLLLFDSTLARVSVLLDWRISQGRPGEMRGPVTLMRFRGDSALFLDLGQKMVGVIGPDGRVVRTSPAPPEWDMRALADRFMNRPAVDPQGRIVFRGRGRSAQFSRTPGRKQMAADTAPLLRIDASRRHVDTVAMLAITTSGVALEHVATGEHRFIGIVNPLPIVDEWALLSDGTIAIVRGQDYRVEWIAMNGAKSSSPPLPHTWVPLTPAQKESVVVAERRVVHRADSAVNATMSRIRTGDNRAAFKPSQREVVSAAELPDRWPAFAPGAVLADEDGRLWIRTMDPSAHGATTLDVVDRRGRIVARVELPRGRTLVAVGRGGLYWIRRDASGSHLERSQSR